MNVATIANRFQVFRRRRNTRNHQ